MILDWLKRYRHGRGFGIHSPFAYRLITEVLTEECPYYDFDSITDRRMRLIYRLVCRFQPQIAFASTPLCQSVVKMASPSVCLSGSGYTFAVDDGSQALNLEPGIVTVVLDRSKLHGYSQWLESQGYGMIFDNDADMAVVVTDPKLPRQDFAVRF